MVTDTSAIHVVVAVIRRDHEVLVARRQAEQHQGGLLEFPGGKVELGEQPAQALVRELKEELDIDVDPADVSPRWMGISHAYSDKQVFLDVREISRFSGRPQGQEGQAVQWLAIDRLISAEFPEANREIIRQLQASRGEPTLTHLNAQGEATMVDVGTKAITHREALAEAKVRMQPETLALIVEGRHKKGDVLAVCRVAGIQAAKRTAELIPLCHSLNLTRVQVDLQPLPSGDGMRIQALCALDAKTGVEMEALTAASVAALTLYDMCKAVDRGMTIEQVRLIEKKGGRSGHWQAD